MRFANAIRPNIEWLNQLIEEDHSEVGRAYSRAVLAETQ